MSTSDILNFVTESVRRGREELNAAVNGLGKLERDSMHTTGTAVCAVDLGIALDSLASIQTQLEREQ